MVLNLISKTGNIYGLVIPVRLIITPVGDQRIYTTVGLYYGKVILRVIQLLVLCLSIQLLYASQMH